MSRAATAAPARRRLLVALRVGIGGTFVVYGAAKLAGVQLAKLTIDAHLSELRPLTLFWYFFGYSPFYAKFLGVLECAAGAALLHRRTALAGALASFGMALNITVLDFCFGFPNVKYFAALLTAGSALLLWADRARLAPVLWERPTLARGER